MKNTEPTHLLTFIAECYRFTSRNGITSWLKVDKDNTVADLPEVLDINDSHPGGIIAEMQNTCGTIIDKLYTYYRETDNKHLLARLDKLKEKYKNA